MLVYQRVGFDPSADHLIISVSHCHISVQLQELQGPAFAYELNWVWPRPLEQFRTILVADLLYSHQYKYIHCFWFAYIIIYLYKCVYHIYIYVEIILYMIEIWKSTHLYLPSVARNDQNHATVTMIPSVHMCGGLPCVDAFTLLLSQVGEACTSFAART